MGQATGRFPQAGELRVAGDSPRYQLYPTRDGKLVACGALEQKFWLAFTTAIGLTGEFVDDARDAAATKKAIAKLIAARTADEWRPVLAAADCCATIVASLEQALRDPHFVARGLFAHEVAGASGKTMPALPLPIAPNLRAPPGRKKVPLLGGD
jgi:crotonobetainyl-CoA:carnitine CoA-transferase CaiB-like acyl-CoA transferase